MEAVEAVEAEAAEAAATVAEATVAAATAAAATAEGTAQGPFPEDTRVALLEISLIHPEHWVECMDTPGGATEAAGTRAGATEVVVEAIGVQDGAPATAGATHPDPGTLAEPVPGAAMASDTAVPVVSTTGLFCSPTPWSMKMATGPIPFLCPVIETTFALTFRLAMSCARH